MNTLLVAFVSLAGYIVSLGIYRLLFHPLRNFPGPRLAAFTEYYRAYFDVFENGGWVHHMRELHEIYGPIVRVTPNELHFSDPDAFDEIHAIHKCIKDDKFYSVMTPYAVVSTVDPQLAAKKRARLGTYFSRRAVIKLEHLIQQTIDNLVERLSSYASTDKPADLSYAFRSTTVDIISAYLFSQKFKALDYPDFRHPHLSGMDEALRGTFAVKWIPFAQQALTSLPLAVLGALLPAAKPQVEQTNFVAGRVEHYTANPPSTSDADHRTIFDVWLQKSEDGEAPKNPWTVPKVEVVDECMSLQVAGSDTAGNATTIGAYHLLTQPEVLRKLRQELDVAWPDLEDRVKFESLEKLPYLTAVIKESLRLSHGVASPMPRVTGPAGAVISGQFIPPGTTVGSGALHVHTNPNIFKEPTRFLPERWLQEDSASLEKYLVAFSKGPRQCLGVNLAWAELYLIFANVFRKLDLEVFEPTVKTTHFSDFFVPVYGNHLHALVKTRSV